MARVLRTWSNATCGALSLGVVNGLGSSAVHGDGVNTITFITDDWSSVGPADAAAATDVAYEKRSNGVRIVEADIYVNAQDFAWSPTDASAKDLEVALLHEVGHALGLLHPCEPGGDSEGAPDCATSSTFADAAMYPLYDAQALALGDDDRAGLCSLYGCEPTCQAQAEAELAELFRCETFDDCSKQTCGDAAVCKLDRPGGTACEDDRQCNSGHCKKGECVTLACDGDDPPEHCIESDLARFGEDCTRGEDCISNTCLLGATAAPICTHPCDPGDSRACPPAYACENVDGAFVCAPPAPPALGGGGGCAAVTSRSSTPSTHLFALSVLALLVSQRRRSPSHSRKQHP